MGADAKLKGRPFTKMYGTGNDFVVLPCFGFKPPSSQKLGRDLCDRRRGVGADQLLMIHKSKKADFKLQTINPDGSEAEMCGNGIRCAAKFLMEEKFTTRREIKFETPAGIKAVKCLGKHSFQVDMGEPIMKGKDIPVNLSGRIINRPLKTELKEFRITCLSMGNPHCVIFTDDLENYPVEKVGPYLETYHCFPRRANIEFVSVVSASEIKMRVWERGAGETDGCGTGACAAAVASVLNGFTGREVTVVQQGGKVAVEWDKDTGKVILTGIAEVVFKGEVAI
jgi:diaminopimelate epimerase